MHEYAGNLAGNSRSKSYASDLVLLKAIPLTFLFSSSDFHRFLFPCYFCIHAFQEPHAGFISPTIRDHGSDAYNRQRFYSFSICLLLFICLNFWDLGGSKRWVDGWEGSLGSRRRFYLLNSCLFRRLSLFIKRITQQPNN